ncbi:MAG: cytochrome c, partial [Pseudomonadota bacterium]|nr:cytochrome c [Pseudomonadota bacterium]
TPFDIGQCRRDCPNFRAIEDRLPDIFSFLISKEAHAGDLHDARANAKDDTSYSYESLVTDLEAEFGSGAVERGRTVFAENCARCHSSIPETVGNEFKNRDFRKIAANGLREDWLGNDQPTKATEVGTYRCRALHSNHMAGHIYQQYGSETLRKQAPDPNIKEGHDGGRGYYRNISLLSLWAQAPLMHNNAIGPELCGQPSNKANDFFRLRYADASAANFPLLPESKQPACWPLDPSVEGRFKLYVESMRQLLNPDTRGKKITRFNFPVVLDFGPKLWDGKEEKQVIGIKLEIPAGTAAGLLGNFQHKLFVNDLVLAKKDRNALEKKLALQLGEAEGNALATALVSTVEQISKDPAGMIAAVGKNPKILEAYSTCTADIENDGHRFGESLPPADKNALTAFLATL